MFLSAAQQIRFAGKGVKNVSVYFVGPIFDLNNNGENVRAGGHGGENRASRSEEK